MLKKIFHKLLFVASLLGLLLSCTNGINTKSIGNNSIKTLVFKHKNSPIKVSIYHGIEDNNDSSDFFYEEAELENDTEFDYLFYGSNSKIYASSVTENQKLYNKTSFCLLQKTNPLYDLYCNWKHHII
jgi:hypothetical protein